VAPTIWWGRAWRQHPPSPERVASTDTKNTISWTYSYPAAQTSYLIYCHVIDCEYRQGLDWLSDILNTLRK
jgi:hypothetical protein